MYIIMNFFSACKHYGRGQVGGIYGYAVVNIFFHFLNQLTRQSAIFCKRIVISTEFLNKDNYVVR